MLFEILVSVLSILLFTNMGIFSYLWGRRPLIMKAGLVMLPATSIACLVEIIQLYSPDLESKTGLYLVSALLFVVIFTSFLFMVLEITRLTNPFKPRVFIPLMAVPSIAILAIITDPWLHLFNHSATVVISQSMNEPILLVTSSLIGFIWIAYFDIVGTIFALFLFLFLYRNGSKGLAFVYLGGVILIHSYIFASYFIEDLNAVYPDNLGYAIAAALIYIYSFRYGVFDLAPASKQKTLDIIQDNIITVDYQGHVTEINQACRIYLGSQAEEVIGKQFSEAFASIPGFGARYHNFMELPHEITDSSSRTFEVITKEFVFGRSASVGHLVVMHDITERKKMEEELRQAEAKEKIAEGERKYRTVVDNQTEAIVSFRPDGTVTFINSVLERNLGMMGIDTKDLNILEHPTLWESRGLNRFIGGIDPTNPIGEFDQLIIMPDRSTQDLLWRAKGIFDRTGTLQEIQAVGIDITRLRRLEKELARNQKLESLGVLAGGIAHDFNNMLVAIVNNTEIAILDHPEDRKHVLRLEESVNSAMRAKKLTQQLLTFSKGGAPIKEEVDLISLIHSSVDLVLAGSTVSAFYDVDDGLHKVSADPSQIEQVINNLVINAVQAMPFGGCVYVKAGNVRIQELDPDSIENRPCVQINVADEGVGISKENLDRIFDPFFTTKDFGSGLGLTMVNTIVKNHGGRIKVESEIGKGTAVSITLPSLEEKGCSSKPTKQELQLGGHGRILVMDDEEPILEVVSDMLGKFGYTAYCVRCGEEAIVSYREGLARGLPFDGMIMDLTIRRGMGGKEAIKEILSLDPGARVIVSSGYSNDPIMARPQEYGFRDVLTKPFTMQELSTKLSALMGQKSDSG